MMAEEGMLSASQRNRPGVAEPGGQGHSSSLWAGHLTILCLDFLIDKIIILTPPPRGLGS